MGPEIAFADGTFDPEVFRNSEYGKNALEMQKIYYDYRNEPMHEAVVQYWMCRGVKKEVYDMEVDQGQGRYSVFTPICMDKAKKYPVVYCSHGGGDDIGMAETYGYNNFIPMANIICVYPWNRGHGNEGIVEEFDRIIQKLQDDGYPIDLEKIYAVGFSAGSVASLRLAMERPNILAGVGCVPGPNAFRGSKMATAVQKYKANGGQFVPLICVGGGADGGDRWPLENYSSFNSWMKDVADVSQGYTDHSVELVRELSHSKDVVKRKIGIDFDRTWINFFEETFWYCGDFLRNDGVPCARFISVEGLPHIHCRMMAMEILTYLCQFSRDQSTGECHYFSTEVNHAKNS